MIRNYCKKQLQIIHGDQVIRLCGLYDAVDHGTGFGSVVRLDHNEVLSPDRERTDGLFSRIVVHGNFAVGQEDTEIGLLVDAVGKGPADRTVMGDLGILLFYPCEIGVHFILKEKLTLLQTICRSQIIITVISVKHLCDPVVSLLGNGTFGSWSFHGFDKLRKRSPCMDPAACDGQIFPFISKGMVDLVSVRDDRAGEVLQEFPWMIAPPGWLPFIQDDRMGYFGRPAAVDPHVGLLAIGDVFAFDPHHLDWAFICMDDPAVLDVPVQVVKQKGKIIVGTFDHPVGKSKKNGKNKAAKTPVPAAESRLEWYTTPFEDAKAGTEKSLFCTKRCG